MTPQKAPRTNHIVFNPQLLWRVIYFEPSNLIFLVNLSNNQAPPVTTSSFSAISADNSELSDDLIGHALGLGVRGAAILLSLR